MVKKAVISTRILLRKAVNHIQIFARKTVSDSFDFAIKDIAGALFLETSPMHVKGADFFVDGASGVAEKFHIPQIVIGLTIVAFGTSAPEAAISISAALAGTTGIAIGNILGSNIFNILFVLGTVSLIAPVDFSMSFVIDGFISIAVVFLLYFLSKDDDTLSRRDGVTFLGGYAVYFVYLIVTQM